MKKNFFDQKILAASLLLAMLAAATEVPQWISLFAGVMILWRYLHEKINLPKISKLVTPLIGLGLFAIVYAQYNTVFGQEESITILLGLTAIAVLNYETERDHLLLVLLGFLVVVLKSVFSLDFLWLIPATVAFFGFWLTLLNTDRVNKYTYLLKITLRSVPILLILFLLFPRLVIFQTQKVRSQFGVTGFSEELNPGRISRLVTSEQMVFRAEFQNNSRVVQRDLYWRGAVLKKSNGLAWSKGSTRRFVLIDEKNEVSYTAAAEDKVNYKIVLEPIGLRNVFVLDTPLRISSPTAPVQDWATRTYSFLDNQQQSIQFSAESTLTDAPENRNDPIYSEEYLQVPALTERTKNLVEQLSRRSSSPVQRVKALESYFRDMDFIYTLQPPAYQNDMEEFLFSGKKGFCEHFAASFATLARALGVPARVVLGYQGGTYNSVGQFWKISQKDAHAWVEVGLNNRWRRIDPTEFVSPLRIDLGAEEYFSLSPEEQRSQVATKNPLWAFAESIWNTIYFSIENLNYHWTLFLLNYDLQAQLNILNKVRAEGLLQLLGGLGAIWLASRIWKLRNRRRSRNNKEQFSDLFQMIASWSEQSHIQKEQTLRSQTPLQKMARLSKDWPAEKDLLEKFAQDYTRVLYQEREPLQNKSTWHRKLVKFFRRNSNILSYVRLRLQWLLNGF